MGAHTNNSASHSATGMSRSVTLGLIIVPLGQGVVSGFSVSGGQYGSRGGQSASFGVQ
jgi:hypothetical protein